MDHHHAFQYGIIYLRHIFRDCNAFFLKAIDPHLGLLNVVLAYFVAFTLGPESFFLHHVHVAILASTPMEFLSLKFTFMIPSFTQQYL